MVWYASTFYYVLEKYFFSVFQAYTRVIIEATHYKYNRLASGELLSNNQLVVGIGSSQLWDDRIRDDRGRGWHPKLSTPETSIALWDDRGGGWALWGSQGSSVWGGHGEGLGGLDKGARVQKARSRRVNGGSGREGGLGKGSKFLEKRHWHTFHVHVH